MPNDDNDHGERISLAATNYRKRETNLTPFWTLSPELYDLLIEKAFMEGAQWYNEIVLERDQNLLKQISGKLEEVAANAH